MIASQKNEIVMNVLYIHNEKELDDKDFCKLVEFVPDRKRQRILKYISRKNAQNSLLGESLLHYALSRYYTGDEEISFDITEYGKPVLQSHPNIYFNISHTDDYIACAISRDMSVGIDVEMIKPIELDLAERFFTKGEYEYITNRPLEQQTQFFFRIWTRKESYVKMLGKGLAIPLKSFEVINVNDIYYTEFLLNDEVIGSVCARKEEEIACEEVQVENLLRWLFEKKSLKK